MRGTIVVNDTAGRMLQKKATAVRANDVLDCVGGFRAGDPVYLAFRTLDGSQFVVAKAIAACDEAALARIIDSTHGVATFPGGRESDEIVVQEHDVQLLWPACSPGRPPAREQP